MVLYKPMPLNKSAAAQSFTNNKAISQFGGSQPHLELPVHVGNRTGYCTGLAERQRKLTI